MVGKPHGRTSRYHISLILSLGVMARELAVGAPIRLITGLAHYLEPVARVEETTEQDLFDLVTIDRLKELLDAPVCLHQTLVQVWC